MLTLVIGRPPQLQYSMHLGFWLPGCAPRTPPCSNELGGSWIALDVRVTSPSKIKSTPYCPVSRLPDECTMTRPRGRVAPTLQCLLRCSLVDGVRPTCVQLPCQQDERQLSH